MECVHLLPGETCPAPAGGRPAPPGYSRVSAARLSVVVVLPEAQEDQSYLEKLGRVIHISQGLPFYMDVVKLEQDPPQHHEGVLASNTALLSSVNFIISRRMLLICLLEPQIIQNANLKAYKVEAMHVQHGSIIFTPQQGAWAVKTFLEGLCRLYPDLRLCTGCRRLRPAIHVCPRCHNAFYCSNHCRATFQTYHAQKYCNPVQKLPTKLKKNNSLVSSSTKPILSQDRPAGLTNLGNTCYMNSVLQCLSNTEPLVRYLIQQPKPLQKQHLDSKCRLWKATACLFKELKQAKQKSLAPKDFKKCLSEALPMFQGYGQHDVHELYNNLVYHLDQEHSKCLAPEQQLLNSEGQPAEKKAKKQSIIASLFAGMQMSKLTCLECSSQSIIYQKYTSICLPLVPSLDKPRQIIVHIIYHNFWQPRTQLTLDSWSHLTPIKLQMSIMPSINRLENQFGLYFLAEDQCIDISKLSYFELQDKLRQHDVFALEYGPEERKIFNKFVLPVRFSHKSKKLRLKLPFVVNLSTETGLDLQRKILNFLATRVIVVADSSQSCLEKSSSLTSQYVEQSLRVHWLDLKLVVQEGLGTSQTKIEHSLYPGETIKRILCQKMGVDLKRYTMQQFSKCIEVVANYRMESKKQKQLSFKYINFFRCFPEFRSDFTEYEGPLTLYDCIKSFQQEQFLFGDNKVFCEQCYNKTEMKKKITIHKTPQVLVLSFNRFRFAGPLWSKNNSVVCYPAQLSMSEFVIPCEEDGIAKKQLPKNKFSEPAQTFKLFGVIQHQGTPKNGHYIAFCFSYNKQKWYEFNDSKVREVTLEKALRANAYMLFYRRIKA